MDLGSTKHTEVISNPEGIEYRRLFAADGNPEDRQEKMPRMPPTAKVVEVNPFRVGLSDLLFFLPLATGLHPG